MNKPLTEKQLRARIVHAQRRYWRAEHARQAAQREVEGLLAQLYALFGSD